MKRFAGERVIGLMDRLGFDESQALESSMVSRTIEGAQTRVEGYNFDICKRVVEFDDVINLALKHILRLLRTERFNALISA